jgi:hypothetical protein
VVFKTTTIDHSVIPPLGHLMSEFRTLVSPPPCFPGLIYRPTPFATWIARFFYHFVRNRVRRPRAVRESVTESVTIAARKRSAHRHLPPWAALIPWQFRVPVPESIRMVASNTTV